MSVTYGSLVVTRYRRFLSQGYILCCHAKLVGLAPAKGPTFGFYLFCTGINPNTVSLQTKPLQKSSDMPHEELPFWLINVPKDKWPSQCPDFLVDANEKDRRILGTADDQYKRQSWPEVKEIISKK